MAADATFCVDVQSEDFKFSCGHFVAYQGYRERLHGHNYTVSLKLVGSPAGSPGSANGGSSSSPSSASKPSLDGPVSGLQKLNRDGYVADFTKVKAAVRAACKAINEYLIVPAKSDVLSFRRRDLRPGRPGSLVSREREVAAETGVDKFPGVNLDIESEDGSFWSLPYCDVKPLPILHSTAEELAYFLWWDVVRRLGGFGYLVGERGIREMSLSVAERPTQRGTFTRGMSLVDGLDAEFLEAEMAELARYDSPEGWLGPAALLKGDGPPEVVASPTEGSESAGPASTGGEVAPSDIVVASDGEPASLTHSSFETESPESRGSTKVKAIGATASVGAESQTSTAEVGTIAVPTTSCSGTNTVVAPANTSPSTALAATGTLRQQRPAAAVRDRLLARL